MNLAGRLRQRTASLRYLSAEIPRSLYGLSPTRSIGSELCELIVILLGHPLGLDTELVVGHGGGIDQNADGVKRQMLGASARPARARVRLRQK